MWKKAANNCAVCVSHLRNNMLAIQAIILLQCSPVLKAKLRKRVDYNIRIAVCNCAWLLAEILAIMHNFDTDTHIIWSLDEAQTLYYTFKQEPGVANNVYHEQFMERVNYSSSVICLIGLGNYQSGEKGAQCE